MILKLGRDFLSTIELHTTMSESKRASVAATGTDHGEIRENVVPSTGTEQDHPCSVHGDMLVQDWQSDGLALDEEATIITKLSVGHGTEDPINQDITFPIGRSGK